MYFYIWFLGFIYVWSILSMGWLTKISLSNTYHLQAECCLHSFLSPAPGALLGPCCQAESFSFSIIKVLQAKLLVSLQWHSEMPLMGLHKWKDWYLTMLLMVYKKFFNRTHPACLSVHTWVCVWLYISMWNVRIYVIEAFEFQPYLCMYVIIKQGHQIETATKCCLKLI